MTGASPHPPRSARRRRSAKPLMPWVLIGLLFALYVLTGLLLSVPAPPPWVWALAVIGTLLLIFGLNRPVQSGQISGQISGQLSGQLSGQISGQMADRFELFVYLGGLFLVIALAIATNFIGGGQSFDDIRLMVALVGLALLTVLAIVLTAAVAIVLTIAGAKLMQILPYWRRVSILMGTCFIGILIGGIVGFATMSLT
ncbi:MAG: hypothetical protein HC800_06620 [Phormidesmis sp. RL_2_1]|nr:hypothetical protein [Phormidesmis sp. RL_2_1]